MATKADPNYLPDILDVYPFDDERYAGCLWLCRKADGNSSDRTLHCVITPDGKTGLYEPVSGTESRGTGRKTTVRPHDRAHATLVLEDDTPERIERLTSALTANGWKNVVMRP